MLREISWIELLEWRAFFEINPFDEWRADLRTAQIVQAIKNLFSNNPRPIEDYLLPFGKEKPLAKPKQTVAQQWQIAQMWAGKVVPSNAS